jgi:hypothetical protein
MRLRKILSSLLLNAGAGMMVLGGLGDLFVASPPNAWTSVLSQPSNQLPAGTVLLLMALLHALGGALMASGVAILFLANGPLRRGSKSAALAIILISLLSDGGNAFQIYHLGLAYFWVPLTFVGLVLLGVSFALCPSPVFTAES